MNIKNTFILFLAAAFFFVGCRKDVPVPDGGLQLLAEGFSPASGAKTYVDGVAVHWVQGDALRINGVTGSVTVGDGNTAYATGSWNLSTAIRGFYPDIIITAPGADGENTDNPTVVFPRRYQCSLNAAHKQVIALPMVGRSPANSTSIKFYHLSAAVNVRVKNSTGQSTIYLDSVVIASPSKQLCGTASVTLNENAAPLVGGTGMAEGNGSVGVFFTSPVAIAADGILDVQVPLIPISAGTDLTFKVYTHTSVGRIGMPTVNVSYNYSRALSNNALGRNVVGTAQIAITSSGYTDVVDHSLFSVSDNRTVRFSKGNLKCTTNDNWNSYVWSFMENQYSTLETNGTVDSNYANANAVSLFGWGTSGKNTGAIVYKPNATSDNDDHYCIGGSVNNDLTYNNNVADWGSNAISNGGNTQNSGWRTLSSDEWVYLFGNSEKRNGKWGFATIAGVHGIIILPDSFQDPCTNGGSQPFHGGDGNWSSNIYTEGANWSAMEGNGAVFLPAAGKRIGDTVSNANANATVCYWSSTHKDDDEAYLIITNYDGGANVYLTPNSDSYRSIGRSVRLVK